MMDQKFNFELAKAGRPIEAKSGDSWTPVRFIGQWDATHAACDVPWSYEPVAVPVDRLRLTDDWERVTIRCRVAIFAGAEGGLLTLTANDEEEADNLEDAPGFVQWLDDWREFTLVKLD
jgi:hypothetical protein